MLVDFTEALYHLVFFQILPIYKTIKARKTEIRDNIPALAYPCEADDIVLAAVGSLEEPAFLCDAGHVASCQGVLIIAIMELCKHPTYQQYYNSPRHMYTKAQIMTICYNIKFNELYIHLLPSTHTQTHTHTYTHTHTHTHTHTLTHTHLHIHIRTCTGQWKQIHIACACGQTTVSTVLLKVLLHYNLYYLKAHMSMFCVSTTTVLYNIMWCA